MSVQLINLHKVNDGNFSVNEVSDFSSPKSFDMFDINIIDLRSEHIYRNKQSMNAVRVDCISDFLTINEMIANSKKTKFIFIYPKNINFLPHRKRRQLLRIPVSSLSSSTIWFPVTDFLQTEALTASVSPETVLLFALTQ